MENNLFRVLKNGAKYNTLIPFSSCDKVSLGKGDTGFSIEMIISQALKHTNQVAKLAQVLVEESPSKTLESVCNTIHSFLYWHIQYKADADAQLLRSPACAWKKRTEGVDCKSYSIFASAILLQLGVKHYIRKIKQPAFNPQNYSHVYVIVPVDQLKGNLDKGHYTIDGTILRTTEPFYTEKKDNFMDNNLKHYGLNGAEAENTENPENSASSGLEAIGPQFEAIKNFFKNLGCIGGSAYTEVLRDQDLEAITTKLNGYLTEINKAVVANDMNKLSFYANKFSGVSAWSASLVGTKISEGYNSCSTTNLRAVHKAFNFYRYNVLPALNTWLTEYFTLVEAGSKKFGRVSRNAGVEEAYFGQWSTYVGQDIIFDVPVFTIEKKAVNIPKFEITQALMNTATNGTNLSSSDFLNTLQTIISTVTPFIPDNGTGVYNNNNPNNQSGTGTLNPQVKQAGFGVIGWVIVAAGLGYAFTKMKDNPKTSKK